jgi:hypothetical protein
MKETNLDKREIDIFIFQQVMKNLTIACVYNRINTSRYLHSILFCSKPRVKLNRK